MSTGGALLFVIAAIFAIGGAVGTVASKSPLRAAMALLTHIIALAGIFLTLHAHLLAALQLLVYAGAVVVLFVFVIMLIGPSAVVEEDPDAPKRAYFLRWTSAVLMAVVTLALASGLVNAAAPYVYIPQCPDGAECGQFGGVEGLGTELYTQAIVPFELISILLLVGIVGAIAVARGRNAEEVRAAKLRRAEEAARDKAEREREARLTAEVSAHGGH
ncbi:MAG: NADH-quinone oxidoreductase subunit J [Myxococcota bacterium]